MPEIQYTNCKLDPTKPRSPEVAEAMDNSPKVCWRCGQPGQLFDPGELVWWCLACKLAIHQNKRRNHSQ